MTTKKKWLSLMLIFILAITSFSGSADAEMSDGLFPEDEETEVGNVKLESKEYPLSRYGMDTDPDESFWDFAKVSDNVNEGLMTLNSFLWNLNKIFYNFISWIITESFELDIVDSFGSIVGKVIQTLAGVTDSGFADSGLWPLFFPLLVICLGIWTIYRGIVMRQTSVAVSGILSAVAICSLSLGFYANAEKAITNVNGFITEAQNDILSFSLSTTTPGNYSDGEGIASMENQLFNIMIKSPWLLMQFGTLDENKIENEWKKEGNKGSRIDTLLKTKPFSEGRQKAIEYEVKELKNENMSTSALINRLGIIIIALILSGFLGVFLSLITGSLIYFSFMAISGMVVTPITFLAGMIPSLQMTAFNTILKILYAFYMKLILTVLAVVFFVMSAMIYENNDPKNGLFAMFITQIILIVVLWTNREKLIRIVSNPFKGFERKDGTPGLQIKDYKQGLTNIKAKTMPVLQKFALPNNKGSVKPGSLPKPKPTQTIRERAKMAVSGNDVKQKPMPTPSQKTINKSDTRTMPVNAKDLKEAINKKGDKVTPINIKQAENSQSSKAVPTTQKTVNTPTTKKTVNTPASQKTVNTPAPQVKNMKTASDKHKVKQPMKAKTIKPAPLKINDWRKK